MDKIFLENKFPPNISSGQVSDRSESMNICIEKKKSDNGNQKLEENFDFTSDIIDLLLCVENDENARQNIESIMDQWDEMNILGDDSLKSTINAEINAQIKIKNEDDIQEKKVLVTKCSQDKITVADECQPLVNLNLNVQDVVENESDADNKNHTRENENAKRSVNTKFFSNDFQNQTSEVFDGGTINGTNSILILSMESNSTELNCEKASVLVAKNNNSLVAGNSEEMRNQILKKSQATTNASETSDTSAFLLSHAEISKKELPIKSDDDILNEKIKALSCTICHKNYEQLMNSGEIKKIPCKPYPCPFCRGNYYQKLSASIHMKVHMEEEEPKCRLCMNAGETPRKGIKNGNKEIEDTDKNGKRLKLDTFICSICSLSLNSQSELTKHMIVHKSTLKFCRKYLKKQSNSMYVLDCECRKNVNNHVNNKEKPKVCRKCKKTSNHRLNKFECKTCGKQFANKSNYDFHCFSHNTKFTKIDVISEKSNCSSLDHNYGKPINVPDNRRDQDENVKTSKMKSMVSDSKPDGAVEIKCRRSSLMEVDRTVKIENENSKQLNEETAAKFSSTDFHENVLQFDFGLSNYVQNEYSSKTQPIYALQNEINDKISSAGNGSQLTQSTLFTDTYYSQYIKPEVNISTDEVLHNVKANQINGDSENVTRIKKNENNDYTNSCILHQENFNTSTNVQYKNSTVPDESNSLSNVSDYCNTEMLNSDLVSNDMNELQTDELMSNDIDNIFHQYFYPQNDEKILQTDFVENVYEQQKPQYSTLNQFLPIASSSDYCKMDKKLVYNSTADTLSQFINMNMSDGTDLKSNEIIQELFSNMDNTKPKRNNYQGVESKDISCFKDVQTTRLSNPEPVVNENKNDTCPTVKTQNASSVISLANNSICSSNLLANISNLASMPSTKNEVTCNMQANILLDHSQITSQNFNTSNINETRKIAVSTPKSYLVIYVLPPTSNNSQSNANAVVTELNDQKTVVSSKTTKETYFKLPTVESKTTYLVPIINNKTDNNLNQTNEFITTKNYGNVVPNKRHEKIQKNKLNSNNGGLLRNIFKGRQVKTQQKDDDRKQDIKNESQVNCANKKNDSVGIFLNNKYHNTPPIQKSVEKFDDTKKAETNCNLNGNNTNKMQVNTVISQNGRNTSLKNDSVVEITQKTTIKTAVNGNCHKRNILQIAYDDACKLIEDSVTKSVENESNCSADSSMISINNSETQVTTENVTNSTARTTSNSTSTTVTENCTVLKQMLNSKTSLLSNNGTKTDDNSKYFQIPVEISVRNGQVTFQYSQNNVTDSLKLSETINSPQLKIQNEERNINHQTKSLIIKSGSSEKCVCEICHKMFTKSEFLPHLKTHNKTLYKCTYCQEIFVEQLNLVQHMRTHLQSQVFNCKMCKKSFTSVLLFRLHLLVHKGLLFICVSCIKLFNKKEEYENHLKTHNQNYLTCAQCKKNFPNAVNSSSVIQYFTCIECISSGKKFDLNESLNEKPILKEVQHFNTNPAIADFEFVQRTDQINQNKKNGVVKEEPDSESNSCHVSKIVEDLCFECQYCDRICIGGVQLKKHKSSHVKSEIKCVICGEQFAKFPLLEKHFKTHDVRKTFKCDFCSDTFCNKTLYQNHSYKNCKPYPCAICDELFSSKTDLLAHSTSHVSSLEYNCNYCGLIFSTSSLKTMLMHKTSHIIEEISECNKCDEKFVFQSELKIHCLEIHDKQFFCALCDKNFENNEMYLHHRKIHKLFKCDKCNLVLTNEELLLKHKQMHFMCQHCKVEFKEFNDLLSHTIKLHSGKDLKCFKCSCCSRFFTKESQWSGHGKQLEKKAVLLPYSLKQFNNRSFKLKPDTKNIYSCHQCNENFRNKNEIIKHIKSHQI